MEDGVLTSIVGNVENFGKAQFFALVEKERSRKTRREDSHGTRSPLAESHVDRSVRVHEVVAGPALGRGGVGASVAGDRSVRVVIVERPGEGAAVIHDVADAAVFEVLDLARHSRTQQQIEGECLVEQIGGDVVDDQMGIAWDVGLADRERFASGVLGLIPVESATPASPVGASDVVPLEVLVHRSLFCYLGYKLKNEMIKYSYKLLHFSEGTFFLIIGSFILYSHISGGY